MVLRGRPPHPWPLPAARETLSPPVVSQHRSRRRARRLRTRPASKATGLFVGFMAQPTHYCLLSSVSSSLAVPVSAVSLLFFLASNLGFPGETSLSLCLALSRTSSPSVFFFGAALSLSDRRAISASLVAEIGPPTMEKPPSSEFDVDSQDLHLLSKMKAIRRLDGARVGATVLALLMGVSVLGLSADALNVYNSTHVSHDFLLPLWPDAFDLRPTVALTVGAAIVVAANAASLLCSKVQFVSPGPALPLPRGR